MGKLGENASRVARLAIVPLALYILHRVRPLRPLRLTHRPVIVIHFTIPRSVPEISD